MSRVRCAGCKTVVGHRDCYSYGGPRGDDHIDYRELKPNELYGGEYEGETYCEMCYGELATAKERLS